MCDIANISFYFEKQGNYIKDIQIKFTTCNDDYFTFISSDSILIDNKWLQSLQGKWIKMIWKKPAYLNIFRLKLRGIKTTEWTEKKLMDYLKENNKTDILEGIYEKVHLTRDDWIGPKYKIGVVKNTNYGFDVIYLSGTFNAVDWQEGKLKAKIIKTGNPGLYKVEWLMANKRINKDVYLNIDGTPLLTFIFSTPDEQGNQNLEFLKLYPILPQSSGTAFAIFEMRNTESIIIV